jgi:hypothetical protein
MDSIYAVDVFLKRGDGTMIMFTPKEESLKGKRGGVLK